MPDGRLKLLDMYSKMTEMTTLLATDASENQFFDMEYFRLCQTITAMCAGANKLYADSANGQNSYDTLMGTEELKKNHLELHASLGAFRERYMSQTANPNSPFANKLRDLENNVREDREVLRTMDLQPGMSLKHAVYESQKKLELGLPEEEQELPGYDTVHKIDYPGFETLHGLPREDPPEQALPPEDYPSQTTLRMQAGDGMPAVQPYENAVYGTDTFYQNEMDLPSAEDVKRADNEKRKKTAKSLQIWTVAPLTNAIVDETAKTDPAASDRMLKVNMSLQALFNTVRPFNPGRQNGEEPRIPNEQDIAELKSKTAQAHEQLRQWKEAYLRGNEKPSEQVLYMTDNVLKKLEDDYQVVSSVRPGETLPEAAFRSSRLPKHFGLENDRTTLVPCPQKKAEAEKQAQTQIQAPKEAPAAEERIPLRRSCTGRSMSCRASRTPWSRRTPSGC